MKVALVDPKNLPQIIVLGQVFGAVLSGLVGGNPMVRQGISSEYSTAVLRSPGPR